MELRRLTGVAVPLLLLTACGCSFFSGDEFEARRQEMLNRPREVIYNTDGCDAVYYPRELAATKENFIDQRLKYTQGSKIDSVFYCPLSSGFGHLTSRTTAGDQLLADPPHAPKMRNVTGELLAQGTDPLKIAEEYCRDENLEFFASLRVNDTHDQAHTEEKPMFLMSPFKRQHPEFLMGTIDNRPPYCSWSAADFTHQEVRDRMAAIVAEICANYDIDGIEYDFHRHMQLLKSVAWGGHASEEELEMMTGFMKELREITEAAGRKRGRPILVAVRVPDSVGYCRAVGIDLERWMEDKLFDIMIGSSYFQLSPWKDSVELAHRHGIKFYASLDESRISGSLPLLGGRNSREALAARALAAITSGCDGVYYFNLEKAPLRERALGNREQLGLMNKSYYATERGSGGYQAGGYVRNGESFNLLPQLDPASPRLIAPGSSYRFTMVIGDDFSDPAVAERNPVVTAVLRTNVKTEDISLGINGKLFKPVRTAGNDHFFDLDAGALRCGDNEIEIKVSPEAEVLDRRLVILSGNKMLVGRDQAPWRRFFRMDTSIPNQESIVDGALRLEDPTARDGFATSFFYPLIGYAGEKIELGFDLKVEKSDNPEAVVLRVANGEFVETITFEPTKIGFKFAGESVDFNTADAFHHYELLFDADRMTLCADGREILSAKPVMKVGSEEAMLIGKSENIPGLETNGIILGSISGPGTGASLWKNVTFADTMLKLNDFGIRVTYPAPLAESIKAAGTAELVPLAAVGVADGRPEITGQIKNSYRREFLPVRGNALGMIHDIERVGAGAAYQTITILSPELMSATPPPVIIAEWRARVVDAGAGENALQFVIGPRRSDNSGDWELYVRLGNGSVDTSLGAVAGIDTRKFNDFRAVVDTVSGQGALWINGKLAASGEISAGTGRKAPFFFFGDGSGNVGGEAELEYFRIGVPGNSAK